MRGRVLAVAGTSLAVALPAVLGASGPAAAALSQTCGSYASNTPTGTYDHVVWVIYENKSRAQIIGSPDAPYLTSLAKQCAEATNWNHLSQTSLANYIAMTSGSLGTNGEITSNRDPSVWPQSSVSLFEQLGTQAKQLAESQPSPCYMKGSGMFAINHAPLQYYTRINKTFCPTQALPLGSTPDLSAKFTLIVPNKLDDMHRTSQTTTLSQKIQAGDNWSKGYLPKIFASPEYQAGRTVVVLTWDEATKRDSRVPFIVISPYVKPGAQVSTTYDHYSLLRTTESMLGITSYLGKAATARDFRTDFHLG